MKKNLVMFTSVFASLAILSTGFAAWVISGGDEKTEEIGDIVVDTVTDNRHTITVEKATGETGKVVFGHPSATETDAWLTYDEKNDAEKLDVLLKVTVSNAKNAEIANIFDTKSCVLTEITKEDTESKYAAANEAGYVGAMPTVQFVTSEQESTTTLDANGVVYVLLHFTWGTEFGGKNPYTYYNDQAFTNELADDAKNALEGLATLNGVKFNLTLKTNA